MSFIVIWGSRKNITFDNNLPSIPLIKKLLDKQISAVGIIRCNEKEIPAIFVNAKIRP